MKGLAYKSPRHIKLDIFPKDIPRLKAGEIIEYQDLLDSSNDIPTILFNVEQNVYSKNIFAESGFDVRYYPKGNPSDITTCWIKIDKSKFEELLKKEWIGTRDDGIDHLHISLYHFVEE